MDFKEIPIDSVFVIHAKKGYELHEHRINDLFAKNNIDFEFMTDGDVSNFSDELLAKYFTPTIQLSQGVLSCTLNHILVYEKMVANKISLALIFENDPFFLRNFTSNLNKIVKESKSKNGFIISLENTCMKFPSFWQTKKNQHLYPAKMGRAAGAYLINLQAAKLIMEDLKTNKCHTVIDWWHNKLIERGIIKMYWAFPAIVEQGSHNGQLSSTISSNKNSIGRKIKWQLQKFYKYYFRRLFSQKNIIK